MSESIINMHTKTPWTIKGSRHWWRKFQDDFVVHDKGLRCGHVFGGASVPPYKRDVDYKNPSLGAYEVGSWLRIGDHAFWQGPVYAYEKVGESNGVLEDKPRQREDPGVARLAMRIPRPQVAFIDFSLRFQPLWLRIETILPDRHAWNYSWSILPTRGTHKITIMTTFVP
jgi:hypothetical protein